MLETSWHQERIRLTKSAAGVIVRHHTLHGETILLRFKLRILSFHTSYACRHSGACCNEGWIEPVENGRCRFFAAHPSGGCTIHHAHGHDWLPHACQQFPRIVAQSPLGTSLTLSAFCPTAVSLLFEEGPFTITEVNDTAKRYDGMDARNVMPPLLRADMLMDWEAVSRWEDLAVGALSDYRDDVDLAIEIIEAASNDVCATWTPGAGSLSDALADAFGTPSMRSRESGVSSATALKDRSRDRSLARPHLAGAGDMPDSKSDRRPAPRTTCPTLAPAVARYLAGHTLACWPMYDGRGIAGAVEYLRTVRATLNEESARQAAEAGRALDAVLLKEAFRQADVRLRHTPRPVISRP